MVQVAGPARYSERVAPLPVGERLADQDPLRLEHRGVALGASRRVFGARSPRLPPDQARGCHSRLEGRASSQYLCLTEQRESRAYLARVRDELPEVDEQEPAPRRVVRVAGTLGERLSAELPFAELARDDLEREPRQRRLGARGGRLRREEADVTGGSEVVRDVRRERRLHQQRARSLFGPLRRLDERVDHSPEVAERASPLE